MNVNEFRAFLADKNGEDIVDVRMVPNFTINVVTAPVPEAAAEEPVVENAAPSDTEAVAETPASE